MADSEPDPDPAPGTPAAGVPASPSPASRSVDTDASPTDGVAVVVLAAGKGSRMKSDTPKHLHRVAGVPIVERVIRAARGAAADTVIVMVNTALADLDRHLVAPGPFELVVQGEPKGNADTVRQALEHAGDVRWAVALLGDSPLLTPEVVADLLAEARRSKSRITLLTSRVDGGGAYGRIERDGEERITAVIEAVNDNSAERAGSVEINSGVMVLDARWARCAIGALAVDARSGELLLTDLIAMAVAEGPTDHGAWPVAASEVDPSLALGVNDRADLAHADAHARQSIRERLYAEGVTLIGPETVFVDEDVQVGRDTVLHPNTILRGTTVIGTHCEIGPSTVLEDVTLGDRVVVEQSTVRASRIGSGTHIGPFAHVRSGCEIGRDVHIGTHAELNRAALAEGVKCGHFSYLGDCEVGAGVNIGAGTVTANYDGTRKQVTRIGAGAFIGSDTVLVAPVTIGTGARTGAGSVVNRDVAEGTTVVGVPARAIGPGRRGA